MRGISALEPIKTVEYYQKAPSPQTFAAGEKIFNVGDIEEKLYGVVSGEVELWVNGKLAETIHEGDIFGEGALVHEDGKQFETAIAKTDCHLAYLERPRFLFVVQQTPMFALEVIKSYSDRLRRVKQCL
ncbi:MAG: Crp/Fnr family transcriptional regulator [Cyanobacteria bacterium J06643_4]